MAGEDQYIHPIIQAILGAQQMARQGQELALRKQQIANEQESRQSEAKYRQGLLDEAQKRLDQEHEYQTGMLANENKLREAQLGALQLNARKMVQELTLGGARPESLGQVSGQGPIAPGTPGMIAGTPDQRVLTLPGGMQINVRDLPTSQDLIQAEMNKARGLSAAQAEGAEPSKEAYLEKQQQGQQDLERQREEFENNLTNSKLAWDKIKNKLDNATRLQIAGMTTGAEMKRAQMEYGYTPEQAAAMMTGLATGQITPNFNNPRLSSIGSTFIANGGRLPGKNDGQMMRDLGQMKDVYDKMHALEDLLPSEKELGPVAATANALGMSHIAHSQLSTDLKNKLGELQTDLFPIMKNVEGYGGTRMYTSAMQTINGVTNVGTKEQMKDFENSLKNTVSNRIINQLETGMPSWQQNMIYHANGVTPAWVLQGRNPDMESKGYTLDLPTSIAKGKVIYDAPGGQQ